MIPLKSVRVFSNISGRWARDRASASVIPHGDKTLLLHERRDNQFKDVSWAKERAPNARGGHAKVYSRFGKAQRLEESSRHVSSHTLRDARQLVVWDYYKREAIKWAWELLTKEWKLDKTRLMRPSSNRRRVGSTLASETDIDKSHILRFGAKDNFWEMGRRARVALFRNPLR